MQVSIIGSGNVATVLGRRIIAADHEIVQVMSREVAHAKILADEFHCDYTDDVKKVFPAADLYIFAVSDNSIEDLASGLHLKNKIALHRAGSVSKNFLQAVSKNYGVLYPLQTLRKEIHSDIE